MKRIFIFLICFCMVGLLSACKSTEKLNSSESVVTEVSSITEVVSSQPDESVASEVSSAVQSVETQVQSVETVVSSKSEPVVKAPINAAVGTYTVNDTENSRGLSNQKQGFGFGVAQNGVAHSISFNNQARFDSMPNVEALALDTKSADKRMYLTFDCGYEYNNLTANILDTLKEKNVKAAFFVTLSYIKSNPQLVRRMIDEGHIVGNHSANHPVFPDISRVKMAEELFAVDDYLEKNFGYKNKYFRFPTGANSENSLELVTSVGYKSIFWSLAYGDYDTANQMGYDAAYNTVTSRFHKGAVILLHAVSQDNANILGAVIDNAHSQGYAFKTLDDYYVG